MSELPRRGELWWAESPDAGRRPALVISRDGAISRLRRVMIAPCTTNVRGLPSEVVLEPGEDPVARPTAVTLDTIDTVSVGMLTERVGTLSDQRMRQVCSALAVATDCF
ncbi:MAG: type II toxin-antitoxin system PemK/MazF family toxin [Actinomycetota bacterium]